MELYDLRQRAFECEERARLMPDPKTRCEFREMAQTWREMATQLEQLKKLEAANG